MGNGEWGQGLIAEFNFWESCGVGLWRLGGVLIRWL